MMPHKWWVNDADCVAGEVEEGELKEEAADELPMLLRRHLVGSYICPLLMGLMVVGGWERVW